MVGVCACVCVCVCLCVCMSPSRCAFCLCVWACDSPQKQRGAYSVLTYTHTHTHTHTHTMPDGYLIDFGDVKRVTRTLCKELNEHLIVPMRSDVITIQVHDPDTDTHTHTHTHTQKGGIVKMTCEDGATFMLPRGDCVLLPIVHSTAEGVCVCVCVCVLIRRNETCAYVYKHSH